MRDDRFAVAERFATVDDVGQLPARRRRSIENVLMPEWHAGEPHERENLQAIAVIVGDAEQLRVGIERDHSPWLQIRAMAWPRPWTDRAGDVG